MATFTNVNRGVALSGNALAQLGGGRPSATVSPALAFDRSALFETFRPPLGVQLPGVRFPPVVTLPTPQPTAPQQPASPTASASDLQILMSQIPAAEDGDVIRSEHFNLMRAALFELAGRLGVGPVATSLTVSVVPALLPMTAGDVVAQPWTLEYGLARAAGANVRGWMEVELPDGSRVHEMKAFATHTGRAETAGSNRFTLSLYRRTITEPGT